MQPQELSSPDRKQVIGANCIAIAGGRISVGEVNNLGAQALLDVVPNGVIFEFG